MSIYDINFQSATRQLLPPDKRGDKMKAWISALFKPLQWLRDLWMGDYRTGSAGTLWLNSTTYGKGEIVKHKGSAYESVQAGNINHSPLDTDWWMLRQQNFVGVFERILYTGDTLVFTYAINTYFGTAFRQPNNVSDIYITAYAKNLNVFIVGAAEDQSSKSFDDKSSEFVINDYAFSTYYNMSINIPVAVFNALDTDPVNRESIIRNFADKYIIAGVVYSVVTY